MTTAIVIVLAVLAVVVVAAVLFELNKRRQLQKQFGPEYDRTVKRAGGRRAATRDLEERTQRHEEFDVRPLEPQARAAYVDRWRAAQQLFVDAPVQAVREADELVALVMHERGYPIGDFDQQARDVSVQHADAVGHYRAAHEVSVRSNQGQAGTEDLRNAMVHYRFLFAELLADGADPQRA